MELDDVEDEAVFQDLYDDKPFLYDLAKVNGPSYRRWKLDLPVRLTSLLS